MGALGAFWLTTLLDSNANFFVPSLPVYLRYKNFNLADVGPSVNEMGFTLSPVISGQFVPGTSDIQILPPPGIRELTLKQLSDAKALGANLRIGARVLSFTHTWVSAIQTLKGYADPKQVFIDPSVVGIVTDNLLYEIVSYVHNDMYGSIINWDVICNCNEIK